MAEEKHMKTAIEARELAKKKIKKRPASARPGIPEGTPDKAPKTSSYNGALIYTCFKLKAYKIMIGPPKERVRFQELVKWTDPREKDTKTWNTVLAKIDAEMK